MNIATVPNKLTAKDYASDQEVRWCPGCGDYAILKAVQRTLADLGSAREKTVFVSGIGCSSRFPYYMSTYGFHTIHGRAPAIATGIKLAAPDLDVWVVTGDGDGLSIGGNHMLHVLRRNVDLQILLFNNETYGLTKGQYSPTSRLGTRSPSTPMGSVDQPILATLFALGAGARFVARAFDTQQKRLPEILRRAHDHKGASFVEILQNCIVYNDGVFDSITEREFAADTQLYVEHGKPLRFGEGGARGIRLKPGALELEVVTLGVDGVAEGDLLIHDERNRTMATMLTAMAPPEFPMAFGVLYCNPIESFEHAVHAQMERAKSGNGLADLNALLRRGNTWTVLGSA